MNENHNWISCIDHPKFIEIDRILAANDIKGMGEFYVSEYIGNDNNYLLACTRYGNSFVYYNVNLTSQSIQLTPGKNITTPYENPLIR